MSNILLITIGLFLLLEFVAFTKEAIHTAILSVRLNRYLKEKHYSLWRELTSFKGLGPGLVNPMKSLPWLFRDESGEDEQLVRLKDAARIHTRWFFVTGGAFFLTVTLAFVGSIVYALVFQ